MTKRGGGGRDGGRWTRHTVTAEEAGRTVQDVLTGTMGVSRRMIQRLTRSRGVSLNGRPAYLKRAVKEGDVVAARLGGDEAPSLPPVAMELRVAHEDGDVLVVDKPAGLLVHPVRPEHTRTLAHGVAHHLASRGVAAKVRPVHRLDRDTSGLVLFALSAPAHAALDRQLRDHTLGREYLAWVEGRVEDEAGTIDAPVGRDPRRPNLRVVRDDGDPAVTRWRVEARGTGWTRLRLELETGRTHQIRVHLAHVGHPVIGDGAYGARARPGLRRQALHAARLSFDHPSSGERIVVDSEPPAELLRLEDAAD